jgi:hypothetical protein
MEHSVFPTDAIAFAATISNLVSSFNGRLQVLGSIVDDDASFKDSSSISSRFEMAVADSQTCHSMLKEVAQKALTIELTLPSSAIACLRLCTKYSDTLLDSLERTKSADNSGKEQSMRGVRESLDDFRKSATQLRSIVME